MALPKFLLAVPLIAAGAALPGFTDGERLPARPNLVGMEQEVFDRDTVTIDQGETIDFVNNSNFLHVLAPGDRARVFSANGVPSFGKDNVVMTERGVPYRTGAWMTPGKFQLTCTLHPRMNLTVTVEA